MEERIPPQNLDAEKSVGDGSGKEVDGGVMSLKSSSIDFHASLKSLSENSCELVMYTSLVATIECCYAKDGVFSQFGGLSYVC